MIAKNLKKYEVGFLIAASLLFTLINNLPYYSMLLFPSDMMPKPDLSFSDRLIRITWYTMQILVSLLILSFVNYYWLRIPFIKKIHKVIKFCLVILVNFLLAYCMLLITMNLAEIVIGYPFGERGAYNYYMWKYIYLTPSAILIAYVLRLIIKRRLAELDNALLREEFLSIQLKTLKDQVQPHFLFNTLNTLSSIIRTQEKEEGLIFVDDLSNSYRYILENKDHDLVELKNELAFLSSLKRLFRKRFGEYFNVDIDISITYHETLIPPMTLQLLFDNAVKHNEISESSPLSIKIFIDNNYLVVSNNINPKSGDTSGTGLGIQNLMKRYEILADKDILIERSEHEFVVRLPIIYK